MVWSIIDNTRSVRDDFKVMAANRKSSGYMLELRNSIKGVRTLLLDTKTLYSPDMQSIQIIFRAANKDSNPVRGRYLTQIYDLCQSFETQDRSAELDAQTNACNFWLQSKVHKNPLIRVGHHLLAARM